MSFRQRSAPASCLPVFTEPESIELFGKYGVFTESELRSRQEITAENYCMVRGIEAASMIRIAQTMILPAVIRHKTNILPGLTTVTQRILDCLEENDCVAASRT